MKTKTTAEVISLAITDSFISPNESDSTGIESANVVDGLFAIARALDRVADAIKERGEE